MDDGGRPGSLPDPAAPPEGQSARRPDPVRIGPWGRLRQIAMILVFDLGGPLLAYALLRSAGMSAVTALVISGGFRPWASA